MKTFAQEKEAWIKFYTTYNDSNILHAENAFFNQHFETAIQIRTANKRFVTEFMNRGFDLSLIPETAEYV